MKFKKYIARRVTRGTMSVTGGIAGGILGQMVIPIPVVGAVVGKDIFYIIYNKKNDQSFIKCFRFSSWWSSRSCSWTS